jgi:hypothetical protein
MVCSDTVRDGAEGFLAHFQQREHSLRLCKLKNNNILGLNSSQHQWEYFTNNLLALAPISACMILRKGADRAVCAFDN